MWPARCLSQRPSPLEGCRHMSRGSATRLVLAEGLSREFLLHHRLCPAKRRDDGTIVVATAPDAILDALDDIASVYRSSVAAEDATWEEVERMIERLTTNAERSIELRPELAANGGAPDDDTTADVRDL